MEDKSGMNLFQWEFKFNGLLWRAKPAPIFSFGHECNLAEIDIAEFWLSQIRDREPIFSLLSQIMCTISL